MKSILIGNTIGLPLDSKDVSSSIREFYHTFPQHKGKARLKLTPTIEVGPEGEVVNGYQITGSPMGFLVMLLLKPLMEALFKFLLNKFTSVSGSAYVVQEVD